MALEEACVVSTSVKNTGGGCDKMLGSVKMIFAAPPGLIIPANTSDIAAWAKTQIHADKDSRLYPFFGFARPLWNVISNDSNDVEETSDYTGEIAFIRAGVSNRTYQTTKGGLCYAEQLVSFRNSGYDFFEVDGDGLYALYKNSDGSYTLLPTLNMGGKAPMFASGNTQFKNQFQISFDPTAYINAKVLAGGKGLLSLKGLEDVDVYTDATSTPSTTTNLYVKVRTECGSKDLVSLLGSDLADVDNFVIKDHASGVVVTPTGAAVQGGKEVKLTGTYITAHSYDVYLADSAALLANDIVYYEGIGFATIAL